MQGVAPERAVALESFSQHNGSVEAVLAKSGGSRETVRTPIMLGATVRTASFARPCTSISRVRVSRKRGRSMTLSLTVRSTWRVRMSHSCRAAWCFCLACAMGSGACSEMCRNCSSACPREQKPAE
jgi:hypothetical protein